MSSLDIGFLGLGAIFVLLALRMPIGLVLGGVSFLGILAILGPRPAYGLLRTIPFDFTASWSISAIPMFLLMGAITYHSGLAGSLYRAARAWLWAVPGGLAIASNFACAGFAAASGSSVATATAMGRLTIPEMLKSGYDRGLSTGVVAAAGTLGSLIPPSILMVLYGIFAEQSVSKLLIAGVIPGLLTAFVYAAMIVGRCIANPELAPRAAHKPSREERIESLRAIWPMPLLILGVIGGIYGGVVTATEAGALGAFLAFLIALTQGRASWRMTRDSIIEALESTAVIFFIAIGAVLLSRFMVLSGIPSFLGDAIAGWEGDHLLLIVAASVIFVLLGMFLDPLGIMLLALPILLPMFQIAGFDLIWFGVLVVKFLEIGLLTPPVGLNVYAVKSVVGKEVGLETIFRGVLWFLACEALVVVLLVAFPQIALWLPGLMR